MQASPPPATIDRRALVISVLSGLVLAFLAGIFVTHRNLPPAKQIRQALREFRDFRQEWRNDLGLRPTRSLIDMPAGRERVTLHDPERAFRGHRLVSGLAPPDKEAFHGVRLLTLGGGKSAISGRSTTGSWIPAGRIRKTRFFMG